MHELYLFLGGHVGEDPQMEANSKKVEAAAKAALEALCHAKEQLAAPLPY